MACGVVVVGSDSGEIGVVIGDAGVVVEEGSTTHLRDVLVLLVGNECERRRLGGAGRAQALRVSHKTRS